MNKTSNIMKAINFKQIIAYIPEVSFLLMAFYWFMDNLMATPSQVNYYMIAIAVFILLLIVWRIKDFESDMEVLKMVCNTIKY